MVDICSVRISVGAQGGATPSPILICIGKYHGLMIIFIKMYEKVPMYGGHFQCTLRTLVNWLPRDLLQQSAHVVCISGGARWGANSSPILMCIGLRSAQVG